MRRIVIPTRTMIRMTTVDGKAIAVFVVDLVLSIDLVEPITNIDLDDCYKFTISVIL